MIIWRLAEFPDINRTCRIPDDSSPIKYERKCKKPEMSLKNIKETKQSIYKTDKKSRSTRVTVKALICVLAIAAISIVTSLIRGQLIAVRNYDVPTQSSGKVRIVAISDLHGSVLGKNQERIVSRVQKVNPDIIVYLGDMVERTHAEESVAPLVVLTQRLAQIAPVYHVDGNHEEDFRNDEPELTKKLNAALSDAGAVQLENETVQLRINENCIVNLCGITTHYYWEEKENKIVADLRKREGINVLLCHYPESVIWYRAFEGGGLDLALCGHTHGGLIRVPFKGGMYAPEWGWWPMYDLGQYPIYSDTLWSHYGGGDGMEYWGTMIISGGLAGEHGVPRVNNPMEISVVDIGQ